MKYLVCLDGSKESEKVTSLCSNIVQESDEIIVYGGYEKANVFTVDSEMLDAFQSFNLQQEKSHLQYLDEATNRLQKKVKRKIRTVSQEVKDIRESIISFAKQNNIDVIMVGTTGKSGLKLLILGSVSSFLVQHAHCSVLLAR